MPLLHMEPVAKIIETAVASKLFSTNERPISVLLLSFPGNGKTNIIKEVALRFQNVKIINSTTGKDLEKLFQETYDKSKRIPLTLLFTDLIGLNSRKSSTARNTWRVLQDFMEDGISYMGDAGGRIEFPQPFRGNIVSAMPVDTFFKALGYKRGDTPENKLMAAQGLLRRMLVVHYDYLDSSVADIHESILNDKYNVDDKVFPRKITPLHQPIEIPRDLAERIAALAQNTPKEIEVHGFSYHKIFRAYAKTRAGLRGSSRVSKQDLDDVRELFDFIRPDRSQGGYKI